MKIEAILFDMDGILIDSEPFWRQAEIEVFATVDVHLTEQQCMETTGLRIDEVVAFRHSQKPWSEPSCRVISEAILDRVMELVRLHGKPLPGVGEALEAARATGLPVALASSSTYALIETTLTTLGIREHFSTIHSAEEEELGKPHPAVYLNAARKVGVAPTACLAIEDSLNGVIAAKAARMQVIAIPESHFQNDPRFAVADQRLRGLGELPQALARLV